MTPMVSTTSGLSAKGEGLFANIVSVTGSNIGFAMSIGSQSGNQPLIPLGSIDVFNLDTNQIISQIPLNQPYSHGSEYPDEIPSLMDITPDGKYLYVYTNRQNLYKIDAINFYIIEFYAINKYMNSVVCHPSSNSVWFGDTQTNAFYVVSTSSALSSGTNYSAPTGLFRASLQMFGNALCFNSSGSTAYYAASQTANSGNITFWTFPVNTSTGIPTSTTPTEKTFANGTYPSAACVWSGMKIDPTNTYIYFVAGQGVGAAGYIFMFNLSTNAFTGFTQNFNAVQIQQGQDPIAFANGKVFITSPPLSTGYEGYVVYSTIGNTSTSAFTSIAGFGGSSLCLDNSGNYFWTTSSGVWKVPTSTSSSWTVVSSIATPNIGYYPGVLCNGYSRMVVGSKKISVLVGESKYDYPGSYTWICPPGVTSVSAVCIGGAQISNFGYNSDGSPDSFFKDTNVCLAFGATGTAVPSTSNVGTNYFFGGASDGGVAYQGAGGAAGYGSNGGAGGAANASGSASSDGGGGGGGATTVSGYRGRTTVTAGGGPGGGVGIWGKYGFNPFRYSNALMFGAGGNTGFAGGSGSYGIYNSGNNGVVQRLGWFGGGVDWTSKTYGGSLSYTNNISVTPGQAYPLQVGYGNGAVRIIWSANPSLSRSFPNTNCQPMGQTFGGTVNNNTNTPTLNNYTGLLSPAITHNGANYQNLYVSGNGTNYAKIDGAIKTGAAISSGTFSSLIAGPDGNMWFATSSNLYVTSLTGFNGTNGINNGWGPNSNYTGTSCNVIYQKKSATGFSPYKIAVGPQGKVWCWDLINNRMWLITPGFGMIHDGSLNSAYAIDDNFNFSTNGTLSQVSSMCLGPDGNMWVLDIGGSSTSGVYKYTTSGTYTKYSFPAASSGTSNPKNMVVGSDGNLWISDQGVSNAGGPTVNGVANVVLWKLTTTGTFTPFSGNGLTYPFWSLGGICSAIDGTIVTSGFDSANNAAYLVKYNTSGSIVTSYRDPVYPSYADCCNGPRGDIVVVGTLGIASCNLSTLNRNYLMNSGTLTAIVPSAVIPGP